MESSLHRQLKALYAPRRSFRKSLATAGASTRSAVEELIEIQHGSLAAIRDKVRQLLCRHHVRVVKPIVAQKTLVKLDAQGGREVDRRRSPKRGSLFDLFDELVYFTKVFPHRRLTLEVVLVEVEEWRYPGRGKRSRRRRSDGREILWSRTSCCCA